MSSSRPRPVLKTGRQQASFPSFSAVIEWENAKLAGAARATAMLRTLLDQAEELTGEIERSPELIILYDREAVAPEIVTAALEAAGIAGRSIELRIVPVAGIDYYQMKNRGAELTGRDFVLFVDSDVLPEPGWLRELLRAARVGADAVSGDAYVDPSTFLGRAFACFWFFGLRSPTGGLRQVRQFFANNVLFRRSLFLAHRYPDLPIYRGQCRFLAKALQASGTPIFVQGSARVCHPPPRPDDFLGRALRDGHDRAVRARLTGRGRPYDLTELRRQIAEAHRAVASRAPALGMPEDEAAAATLLAEAYARARLTGSRWVARHPERAGELLALSEAPDLSMKCRQWRTLDQSGALLLTGNPAPSEEAPAPRR